jgi:acetate kinase
MTTASRNVLVINAGSSSIKFTLFDMTTEERLIRGAVERVGLPGWKLDCVVDGRPVTTQGTETLNHRQALEKVFNRLGSESETLAEPGGLFAVGHRVVHGGERFSDPALIDDAVKQAIRDLFPLAPLHNPPNYEGIRGCEDLLPDVPMVAVFDTAFHFTVRKRAYLYAIPIELYEKDGIRRYGFHGTSHRYVSLEAARILERENDPTFKLITCHLGGGCSMAGIKGGRVADTTMGLTPLEGLVMNTRCGDIDPAIVFHLMREKNMTAEQIDEMLNKRSGLFGLAGLGTGDLREIIPAADSGNEKAQYAIHCYVYRIKKYIGAYTAQLQGLDALVFTAGVGENSGRVRADACDGLEQMGIEIDWSRNQNNETIISTDQSKVKVMVIPTNEELMIARDTAKTVERVVTNASPPSETSAGVDEGDDA